MPYSPLQIREVFHLLFLQEFLRKIDPKLIVLKGGVNLRFFFKSPRYSEDMDLDLKIASITSVQNNVLRALQNIFVPMKVFGVSEIIPPSLKSAKQTQTTQRFKIHLLLENGLDLFTKIEFSRRGIKNGFKFEKVNDTILRQYQIGPVVTQHYLARDAARQKIKALAQRQEVQARDVFDLYHLLAFLKHPSEISISSSIQQKAMDRCLEIGFKEYESAVVAFLSAEDQKVFGLEEMWNQIQETVLQSLEGGGRHE